MANTEFILDGVIELPDGMDSDVFFNNFIDFVESQNVTYIGSLSPYSDDDELLGQLAMKRLSSGGKRYTMEEVKAELGIE